jgi:hypothetical protein
MNPTLEKAARARCRHPEQLVEDGGPRNSWRGYTFCGDCGETIGVKWKRKIDDFCEREWAFRPNRTKPLLTKDRSA